MIIFVWNKLGIKTFFSINSVWDKNAQRTYEIEKKIEKGNA